MSDSKNRNVGFIGAGRMATALAAGLISSGFTSADHVSASDTYEAARDSFTRETGAQAVESNLTVVEQSEIIVLSVKPQHVAEVLEEIKETLTDQQLLVSIAAGCPLSLFVEKLGKTKRLIRVMPNTPCLVKQGASAFARGGQASETDASLVESLLSTVGTAVEVPEAQLDAVTGLSGSGPAYIYQIIEALSDGGVRMGLPRHIATQLAAQTVKGAAEMVLETGEHPGALKDAVTSPGGTTIAGIHALEAGGLRNSLINAVSAATNRSIELGKQS
ncbi:pyrroline-5-carboxylate reductase [Gimesia fumaroli]|uniref:Pyrroline-5-carboxylate reductase n=1 Tax=Gimesia fumaroli TaxID=2527976 RepID=A0A518I688_9PLAN|nr:pyrroline-5-carboxylate reductase [Gimesia fumaroli]QDV48626.1 Pyrroline-5-carboxylate reductase [Gimesia fumaroli]